MRRGPTRVKPVILGSARHLASIVNTHQLRRGRVVPAEVVAELHGTIATRQRDAAKAYADIERLRALAEGVRHGTIELPEPQPLDELASAARRRFMGAQP